MRKGKLQLAKKSTGGLSERTHEDAKCVGAGANRCARRADEEKSSSQADDMDSDWSAVDTSPQETRCMVDKATQCNLLPPSFLESLDRAACDDHQCTRSAVKNTPRPQYAKKSTSTVSSEAELIVQKRWSPTRTDQPSYQPAEETVMEHSSTRASSHAISEDSTYSTGTSSLHNMCTSGQPCEIMCKWGNWDVIFYETPQSSLIFDDLYLRHGTARRKDCACACLSCGYACA